MIKKIVASAVMTIAVATTIQLYAQQPKGNTLGGLWQSVEENYPGIAAKMSAIDAAKFHERSVKSNSLPQIKAQAQNSYGTYEGTSGAFFSQPGLFNVSGAANALEGSLHTANTFGSATLEWELFSFGTRRKEIEAANALYDKNLSEKNAYLLQLKKTLSERYITLLYSDAKLNWTEKNAERLDDIRTITSGLSAAGLRPLADSLLASSSYVQAMGERDKWLGLTEAAFVKLSELHGNDQIDYTTSSKRFTNPSDRATGNGTLGPSHPVLEALDKQVEYYSLSGEAQKKSALPSVRFLGGYAYRGTGIHSNGTVSGAWKDGFNNTTNNVLAGIGITWNVSSLHTNRLKGQELLKSAESTEFLRTQQEQAMQANLTASQNKIKQQFKQLKKTKLGVRQSQDAYDMYLARYKSGLIALSELLQIRTLLEQAENAHIEASRDYWIVLALEAELTADFDYLFNNL